MVMVSVRKLSYSADTNERTNVKGMKIIHIDYFTLIAIPEIKNNIQRERAVINFTLTSIFYSWSCVNRKVVDICKISFVRSKIILFWCWIHVQIPCSVIRKFVVVSLSQGKELSTNWTDHGYLITEQIPIVKTGFIVTL